MLRLGHSIRIRTIPNLARSSQQMPRIVDMISARTFTDDVDVYRILASGQGFALRPGLRDDDTTNIFGKLLPGLHIK